MRWILLRGLTREAGHWGGFGPLLASRTGEPVEAIDLPGNGARWREPSPASVRATTFDACRRTAGPEPVILVAMSLGAMVALEWARLAPDTVAGCALINTSAGGASWPWQRLRPANYPRLLGLLRPAAALDLERQVLAMTSARAAELDQEARRWAAIRTARPVSAPNAVRQLWAAARYRAPREAPPMPLLLLASEGDGLVSNRCSRELAHRWQAPLRMHPWAGHDLPLDDPQWLVRELCEWRPTLGV